MSDPTNPAPTVVITMDGGVLSSVLSDDPTVRVVTVDYDVDRDEDEEDVYDVPQGDGSVEPARVLASTVEVDPARTAEIVGLVGLSPAPPERTAQAFALADESMLALLESEAIRERVADGGERYRLPTSSAVRAPAAWQDAARALRDAIEWLRYRGLITTGRDAKGEYAERCAPAPASAAAPAARP